MFEGRDITRLPPAELRALRRSIQFIYQDPHSALNPRMTILRSVSEPLILHTDLRGAGCARGRADGDGGPAGAIP